MANIEIIYDSRNYTIIKHDNSILCYSYKKLIANYNTNTKECRVIKANIQTQTNTKHLKMFAKYLMNIK